jgi:hypothetical protein
LTAPLDARTLFRLLAEEAVDYVVVGGFAVIAHGVVRATKDLDICPSPEPTNLRRLAELLRRVEARQAGVGDFAKEEMPYDPTGVAITVCSLSDLLVMKRAAGRPQDVQDLVDLAAAHGDDF